MSTPTNDLPQDTRNTVIGILNDRLADAIDLGRHAKQAHWNIKGPHFIALHELFDQVHAHANDYVDLIAERVTTLGGKAEGDIATVAAKSTLPKYPSDIVAGSDHVDALSASLATFAAQARAAIDETDNLGDAVSADILTEVTRGIDTDLWMVSAHNQATS